MQPSNAERELDKEQARLEGAVVETARRLHKEQSCYSRIMQQGPASGLARDTIAAYDRLREARKEFYGAVDALERTYRGEYA